MPQGVHEMGWEQVGRGSTHGSRCTYRWGQTCNMGCGRKLGPRVVERGTRQGSKMLQGTWGGVPPGNTAAQGRAWNMGMKGRARLGAHTTWPSGRAGMFSRLVLACGARAAAHLQVGGSGACLLLPRGVQGRAGRLCPGSRAAGVQRSPSRAAAKVLAAALGHGAGAVRGGKAGKGKAAGRGGTKAALWPAGCNHTQHQPCHPRQRHSAQSFCTPNSEQNTHTHGHAESSVPLCRFLRSTTGSRGGEAGWLGTAGVTGAMPVLPA